MTCGNGDGIRVPMNTNSISYWYCSSSVNYKSFVWWELMEGTRTRTLADQGKKQNPHPLRNQKPKGAVSPSESAASVGATRLNGRKTPPL
jgi:hypothetical protein